ncbi:hypothetical protein BH23CHL5_BH23CHL5_25700 [soil metagenome]
MKRAGLQMLMRFGVAALVIAALAAVGSMQAMAQDSELIIPINENEGSGVFGDATLTDNGDGTTTIDVLVDGVGEPEGGHPIHLHSGTCDTLGDVVVALESVGPDGSSVTDVPVPLSTIQDPEIGPHAIDIHRSSDQIVGFVACGDIPVTLLGVGGEAATEPLLGVGRDAATEPLLGVGGDSPTETTTTPATGIGSTAAGTSSMMALAGIVAAAMVLFAGMGLRRSSVRA